MTTNSCSADRQPPLDTTRRFVRLSGERPNGFIEFDFAIGEPEVFVELILDKESFKEFCVMNKVEMLPPLTSITSEDSELSDWDWRLADARATRFK
jgi:phenol/toluene 2-monooxygenase (NADH) P0/A0